ncbi:YqgM-like family glycosyltransferase [Desulfuromonas sp. DDH964]|uniref:glycosyltransferase family 4 protein n=1 Tax=Desulfuromonas sp. DDH964 TaxID=1823759 RepID=UPI00078DC197|nr:glycosyltransferase family 4 protein [Desulfuromonas sp. DDH964]AMV73152.1 YqgM-like family glycosyltransferase [Desulfuromonas sp. DDH964]
MRILMLAPTPYFSDRGCHVRIYEEARVLRRLGHEVRIVTYHLGRNLDDIPTERIPAVPWYRKLSAGPSWHKPYLDILLLFKAWQVARRFRPDLLHAHLHEGAFVAALLKPVLRLPIVFDCQGSLTGELVDHRFVRKGSLLYRVFYLLEAWICRRADAIVTSATPTAELLKADFAVPEARITAVVDGVDAGDFHHHPGQHDLKRELGLPPAKQVVVFLGAMNEYQGIDLLLDVIKTLSARRQDCHFLLMGYPERAYRERAATLGIAGLVTFTGKIPYDQAARYLSLGQIAISPKLSRTEANGKLFNYMACGLPAVVFDTRINREILGDAGLYAEFGDAEALTNGLAALLDDPERGRNLGRVAWQKALAEHSWANRATLLEHVYHRLLGVGDSDVQIMNSKR